VRSLYLDPPRLGAPRAPGLFSNFKFEIQHYAFFDFSTQPSAFFIVRPNSLCRSTLSPHFVDPQFRRPLCSPGRPPLSSLTSFMSLTWIALHE
jgi:hypothetical protein